MDYRPFSHDDLEIGVQTIDKFHKFDNSAPTLLDVMEVTPNTGPTCSGIDDDYTNLKKVLCSTRDSIQLRQNQLIGLPSVILAKLTDINIHSIRGVFMEIGRAWITVNNMIYMWTYEDGENVTCLALGNTTIISVALVLPKAQFFHNAIKYLLVLSTLTGIVIHAIEYLPCVTSALPQIYITVEAVFEISTDLVMTVIAGTKSGRLFFGSREGSLYEFRYKKNWFPFGNSYRMTNCSDSALSYLVPSFIKNILYKDNEIIQICIDSSRNMLYTLTRKGSITVYDLGTCGTVLFKIATLSQAYLLKQAVYATRLCRPLDEQHFCPVISISVLTPNESGNINMVGVTGVGIRFYFSATGVHNATLKQRPDTFTLVHVRYPPGYFDIETKTLRKVNYVNYRRSNLIISKNFGHKTSLWLINSDMYSFCSSFKEAYEIIPTGEEIWAIAEINDGIMDPLKKSNTLDPPLVVYEQYVTNQKFLVLTTTTVLIYVKQRQSDILRQLLNDRHGASNETIETYFRLRTEDQACASSLELTCSELVQGQVEEWAEHALFIYGSIESSCPSEAGRSSKHNGLYFYLGRILRPIWHMLCVQQIIVSDNDKVYIQNGLPIEECKYVRSHINSLLCFLQRRFSLTSTIIETLEITETGVEAIDEKRSLRILKTFVNHSSEVLGLWIMLHRHEFHILLSMIPLNLQKLLKKATFKNLILDGQAICSSLINALINRHFTDLRLFSSIVTQFETICPKLYKHPNSAAATASRILDETEYLTNENEKQHYIYVALTLCKSAVLNVDICSLFAQFASVGAYHAVIDLCISCTVATDPYDLASHYMQSSNSYVGSESCYCYNKRKNIYDAVIAMLDKLYTTNIKYQPTATLIYLQHEFDKITELIIQILKTHDTLLHISVYEWLIATNDHTIMQAIEPIVDAYVLPVSKLQGDNTMLFNLLHKYYEINGNFIGTAQIIRILTTNAGNTFSLFQRIQKLEEALTSAKATKLVYTSSETTVLHDLEDALQRAKLQKKVLDTIIDLPKTYASVKEAATTLHLQLFTLTELFEKFCIPYNLWECQLAIIDFAKYNDHDLIVKIWEKIIDNILKQYPSKLQFQCNVYKILHIIHNCNNKQTTVPLYFLLYKLECLSFKIKDDPGTVVEAFCTEISMDVMARMYHDFLCTSHTNTRLVVRENDYHLVRAFAQLIKSFLQRAVDYEQPIRAEIKSSFLKTLEALQFLLRNTPELESVMTILRESTFQLKRYSTEFVPL